MLGDCEVHGDCVRSKNYEHTFGQASYCKITIRDKVRVAVNGVFDIPQDSLNITGNHVDSTENIPGMLLSGDTITWAVPREMDLDRYYVGWQICLSRSNTFFQISDISSFIN